VSLRSLPKEIVGGEDKAKVRVQVKNNGTKKSSKRVTATVFASTDQTLDDGDTQIGAKSKTIKIKTGKTKNLDVTIRFPEVAVDTTYNLIVVISGDEVDDDGIIEQLVGQTVLVEAPMIALIGPGDVESTTSMRIGKSKEFKIRTGNDGNVRVNSRAVYELIFTTDGTEGTAVASFEVTNVKVKIDPGKSKKIKAKLRLTQGSIVPGEYIVLVRLNTANSTPTNVTDGNIMMSQGVTVKA
jgi:hypothetical protein